MTNYQKISIIIPNLHSPIIDQTLDSLINQNISIPYEIIVVGQDKFGSVESYNDARIKFIKTAEPTPPAIARNMGADSSTGDYLVFTDSDCVAADDFLAMHLEANNGNPFRMIGGAVSIDNDQNYWTLSDNIATFHEILSHTEPGKRDILPSLNLSLSKKLWTELDGFDPNYPKAAGEDADFSYRARMMNSEVVFTPNAVITHLHKRDNLNSILKHAYTFGEYSIKIDPKYKADKSLPVFIIKSPSLLRALSPILALGVILKIIFIEKLPFRFWHTLPVVKLAKIAWCFGASKKINTT
ncbi:MAG: glycosyltransferase [Bacteroidales bacterium]|nr:glycosyltransferase [Bacteroidales bacterium]